MNRSGITALSSVLYTITNVFYFLNDVVLKSVSGGLIMQL